MNNLNSIIETQIAKGRNTDFIEKRKKIAEEYLLIFSEANVDFCLPDLNRSTFFRFIVKSKNKEEFILQPFR